MEAKINDLDDYGLLQIVDKNDRYEGYFQRDSFVKKKCNRCKFNNIYYLPNRQFYCLDCIQLGRISTLNKLIYRPDPSFAITHQNFMTWKGQLTSQQNFVSIEIIQSLQKNKSHLLWAVTGAGKTETLFPLINYSLQKGYRLAIASPRLDVILELIPRIKLAFANTPIHSMFGGSLEEYKRTPITILTTHQLLKFQEAFDLIIIDEVDSFPYQNNPMLENAVLNALKINGKILYLSATPSKKIIKQNKQSLSFLSQRFHGRELPNFKVRYAYNWLKDLEKQKLPKILKEIIHQNLKQRFLLFVPEVKHLELITNLIKEEFNIQGESVWSGDAQRIDKVTKMRNNQIQFLVTTTILERGVTLKDINVIILGADHYLFNENNLVQIAGRVDRGQNSLAKNIFAIVEQQNSSLKKAIKQINFMNQKALEIAGNS